MTNDIALRSTGNELALDQDSGFWNEKQIAALRQLGVENASNGDLAVYHHVCQRTGLDPFARQIYMIKRDGKQTIQTGIDGFRLVARRAVDAAGETLSISAPEWCDAEGNWTDVWLPETPPSAARVTVMRNGQPFPGIALWREYVQTFRKDGVEQVTRMWATRPAGQLAKCAEALALRRAFPQDLSGVYTDDEMAREYASTRQAPRASVSAEEITGELVEGEVVDEGDDYRPGGSAVSKAAEDQVQDVQLPDPEDEVANNDPALDGGK